MSNVLRGRRRGRRKGGGDGVREFMV